MKVFVISKNENNENINIKLDFDRVDNICDADVVITIGGDGTILRAGKQAALHGKPLLGINTGQLGFMATLEKDELDKLQRLKTGEYSTSRRMLLDVDVGGENHLALNEVVLHRKAMRLPEFAVSRNETEVMKVRADGVIVATPTGSTAYSLSAGGPIIEPEMWCFLVSAICPHTLFNRPMIFSHDSKISVCAKNVFVSVDGEEVRESEKVTITKSKYHLDLIDIDGNNFYDSIHDKLMKPLK